MVGGGFSCYLHGKVVAIGGSSNNYYVDPRGQGRVRSAIVISSSCLRYCHGLFVAVELELRNGVAMVTMTCDGWSDLMIFCGISSA